MYAQFKPPTNTVRVRLTPTLIAHIYSLYLKGYKPTTIAAHLSMNRQGVYNALKKADPSLNIRERAPTFKNEVGNRYGKLTVLSFSGVRYRRNGAGTREAVFLCQCECGNQCLYAGTLLRLGRTKSCGCRRREIRKLGPSGLSKLKKALTPK
jgi:hypothetical protein